MAGPGVLGKLRPGLVLPNIDWGTLASWFLCILGQQLFPSFCLLPPSLLHLRGTHYVVRVEQRDVLVPAVVMNPASPLLETRGGTASAPS